MARIADLLAAGRTVSFEFSPPPGARRSFVTVFRVAADNLLTCLSQLAPEAPDLTNFSADFLAALGEADAGIVYSSDVTPEVSGQVTRLLGDWRASATAAPPAAVGSLAGSSGNSPKAA